MARVTTEKLSSKCLVYGEKRPTVFSINDRFWAALGCLAGRTGQDAESGLGLPLTLAPGAAFGLFFGLHVLGTLWPYITARP